jgi:16S rRNA (cytidine1402-2'-O)-methyltransferase
MSKHYEEVIRGSISELISWAKSKDILGEITVVLAGFELANRQIAETELIKMVLELEGIGESRKEAIAQVAKKNSIAKRIVFDAMVTYKSEDKI